jgi:hypothetical protein
MCPVGVVMAMVPSGAWLSDQPGWNVLIRWWQQSDEEHLRVEGNQQVGAQYQPHLVHTCDPFLEPQLML